MDTISERFKILIETRIQTHRRYANLERDSGIKAISWRSATNGTQRPTAEMLQAISRQFPENAFWLVTGYTDSQHGHLSPTNEINDIERFTITKMQTSNTLAN